jgi:hypothetical protein
MCHLYATTKKVDAIRRLLPIANGIASNKPSFPHGYYRSHVYANGLSDFPAASSIAAITSAVADCCIM